MSLENYEQVEAERELGRLFKQMVDTPATRSDALRLVKRVRDDVPIPEVEMEDRTNRVLEEANKKVQNLEMKLREKEKAEMLKERRQSLLEKGLIQSKDEIAEVEKVMVDKGIASHETAAEHYNWMKQAAAPTPSQFPRPVMSNFDVKGYFKNPVAAARENAHAALMELRKNPKPIGL
jgi:hypothetical protein